MQLSRKFPVCRSLIAAIAAGAAMAAAPARAQNCAIEDRILWVGDSWAEIQWDNLIVRDVLNQFGFGDKREYDDDPTGGIDPNQTAISGMTAQVAADPGGANYPLRITNTLNAKPEIDIVLISLGGNDLIGGGWLIQGPAYNPAVSNVAIVNNINTVAQAALAARPNVEVVIYGYDYVGLWEYVLRNISNLADPIVFQWVINFGNPPAGDFYDDLVDLEARKKASADGDPRIYYVNNLGTMQNIHGHDSANWVGGLTPRPDGTNFPAAPSATIPGQGRVGTDRFGQPVGVQIWRSDVDWIHLSDAAYRELCVNHATQYFVPKFRGVPTATFISGAEDGFVRSNGALDTGQLRMGTETSIQCKSILSFDTSSIPAGATISRASLFFIRSAATGTNPFTSGAQGEPRVDVRNGFFGSFATLEAGDFGSAATATDVGCYAGTVPANNYLERVDLEPAGLAAIATGPLARTQMRCYFQNVSGANNHVSFADGTLSNPIKPFLDVFFTTPTPAPSATASQTLSPTPSASPSASASPTASASPSQTTSLTPSATPSATASRTPSPTASGSPTASASQSVTSTPSQSPSRTASATPSASATPPASASPSPSLTPTPSPTILGVTNTGTPTLSPTATPNASKDWGLYE